MNAGIITKLEYKIDGASSFTSMTYTFFSANFSSEVKLSYAGYSHHMKINFKVAQTGKTNSDTLSALVGRKLIVKMTDGNGHTHTVGSTNYPAHLTYTATVDGETGSYNGYDVTITCESPAPYTIADS